MGEEAELLKEILKWMKFSGMKNVKEVLTATLTNDAQKLVYHNSDGRGSEEIGKHLNKIVTGRSILNWWSGWAKLGIVEPSLNFKGRYKKVFELTDFGIDVPDVPASAPAQVTSSPQSTFSGEAQQNG